MAQQHRTVRYDRIIITAVLLIAVIICIVAFSNGIKNGAKDKNSSTIGIETITTTNTTAPEITTTPAVLDTTIDTGISQETTPVQ